MILDTIVEQKQQEVETLRRQGISAPESDIAPVRGFQKALADYQGVAVIAEAKKASPSNGVICPDFDPAHIAQDYKAGGAQAMSVLTDEQFFQGSLAFIPLVRGTVDLPVLRKDFIVDAIQIEQSKAYGADAILLIAAILEENQLRDYLAQATELGMDVLVEVHDEYEMEKALKAESTLIGVNNRDLRDFSMDLNTTFRLKQYVPQDIPLVSESGIRNYQDMVRLAEHDIAAALVGETLMRAGDRAQGLRALRGMS